MGFILFLASDGLSSFWFRSAVFRSRVEIFPSGISISLKWESVLGHVPSAALAQNAIFFRKVVGYTFGRSKTSLISEFPTLSTYVYIHVYTYVHSHKTHIFHECVLSF